MRPIARRVRILLLALTLTATAYSASPAYIKAHDKLTAYGIGHKVELKLSDHTQVMGNITDLNNFSVRIQPTQAAQPTSIDYTKIVTARDRSSLGSRFKTGPCTGLTLIFAAPFITINYLIGR